MCLRIGDLFTHTHTHTKIPMQISEFTFELINYIINLRIEIHAQGKIIDDILDKTKHVKSHKFRSIIIIKEPFFHN